MIRVTSRIMLFIYLILLFYVMIIGFGRITHHEYMYNIHPFETINHFLQFDKFNRGVWFINLVGNIGVFVPFGILLPIAFEKGMAKTYFIFLTGLFVLESLQLLTKRGSFDIDDFILNSIGFFIGYGLYYLFSIWRRSRKGVNEKRW